MKRDVSEVKDKNAFVRKKHARKHLSVVKVVKREDKNSIRKTGYAIRLLEQAKELEKRQSKPIWF